MLSHDFKLPHPPNPNPPTTEYRQLVSRAITQRLHSPTDTNSSLDAWELAERKVARAKARERLGKLGVSWDEFVRDVERVGGEVHVLTPTRYQASEGEAVERGNERAVRQNQKIGYVVRDREGAVQRRETWYKQVEAMRMFSAARG
ncbi:hypothetical protein HBI18_181400 [Parastagonospora nodorum]|nr:hypothetical protein HBI78_189910 [Parastagonospora nodorum]KAH5716663.1 hypothetical protein HBI18_181400 [Parastagonospora nodorum]KAH6446097.1 hypothetical protein HBI57_223660 [Parastagonospora nodorum]KAH6449129.1 hypothetical protein HBI58_216420 [Parastagonospora nodorum]